MDIPHPFHTLYEDLRDYVLKLGDEVAEETDAQTRNTFGCDFGRKRLCGFAKVWIKPEGLMIWARLEAMPGDIVEGFTSDLRIDTEERRYPFYIIICTPEQLVKAKPFLQRAYERRKQEGTGTPPLPSP